jgi:hypothetical protein
MVVVLVAAVLAGDPVRAQPIREHPPEKPPSLRMRDTAILGERPTPDVFFVVPTGRPTASSPTYRRDYRSEILEPVVKPWLEKEGNLSLASIEHVSTDPGGWTRAFGKRAAPALGPTPVPVFRAPPPALPPGVFTQSEEAVPESPREAAGGAPASVVSPPVTSAPAAPAVPPPAAEVPILVPPQ